MALTLPILCAFDDNYAAPFAAMVTSARAHTTASCHLRWILIETFLTPPMRARIDQWICGLPNTSLQWHGIDTSPIANAPLNMHFTRAAYARLLAFQEIESCDRLLYLDCDLICLSNLCDLWNEPLENKVFGAVMDPGATFCFDGHTEALGMPSGAVHFNSGVLIVDLAEWKRQDLTSRSLLYVEKFRDAIRWADQDVLNALVARWQKLPSGWNVQTNFYRDRLTDRLRHYFPDDLAAVRTPKIVHFNDPFKPWHADYYHPLQHVYQHFSGLSGWSQADAVPR